jgi:carbamate kinase
MIEQASPEELLSAEFAAGSMGPKVKAACTFVEQTGRRAVIGSITNTQALLRGEAGTTVAA